MIIKPADIYDLDCAAHLANELWPHHSSAELLPEMEELVSSDAALIALCFDGGAPVGFAQCQLRSDYVEGTESSPVGYLEGVYVTAPYRGRGIAGALVEYCEKWAKARGCSEFGSDCEIGNTDSYKFHLRVGFSEANRIICFVKKI